MRHREHPLLLLLLSLLPLGCGDAGPRYTSKQVMMEIDGYRKDLERGLSTASGLAGSLKAAQTIRTWMRDPALEHYLERDDLMGDPALFIRSRERFERSLDLFIEALQAGNGDAARKAYPAVQDGCTQCHVTFRPDLLSLPR